MQVKALSDLARESNVKKNRVVVMMCPQLSSSFWLLSVSSDHRWISLHWEQHGSSSTLVSEDGPASSAAAIRIASRWEQKALSELRACSQECLSQKQVRRSSALPPQVLLCRACNSGITSMSLSSASSLLSCKSAVLDHNARYYSCPPHKVICDQGPHAVSGHIIYKM